MRDRTIGINSRLNNRTPSIGRRLVTVVTAGVTILFCTSAPPVDASVFSKLGQLYGCIVTFGQVCNVSETVIGTGQQTQPIPVTCSTPLLNGLPQFLSWPKGKATYRFQGNCSSPTMPGAVMTVRWEGSWNPSETKTDRPNASETVEITGWEPFLPDRLAGGTIRMFWTARCTKDPWLRAQAIGKRAIITGGQTPFFVPASKETDGGCNPFGAYVPDDLRQAFPDIDKQRFPRTDGILSAADKQRLAAEYERVNPSYFSRTGIQPRPLSNTFQTPIPPSTGIVPRPSSNTFQAPIPPPTDIVPRPSSNTFQAPVPSSTGIVEKPSAQLRNIFSRGIESAEQAQPEGQGTQEQSANVAPSSVPPMDEGLNDSPALPPVAITFDQPLHFTSTKGEDTLLNAGIYEIEPVLDLQLSLTREGQEAVLLPAMIESHAETMTQPAGLLVPGESNDTQHLLFLTPDGTRFEAIGSTSGIKSRGTGMMVALPTSKFRDAMVAYSAQPAFGSPQPCVENTLPVGPRWIPPGCKMPSIPTFPGLPASTPFLDGSNMLYACVNNNTGAFHIVRPPEGCAPNGEVKVKWQLAP